MAQRGPEGEQGGTGHQLEAEEDEDGPAQPCVAEHLKPATAITRTLEAKVARVARRLKKAPRLVLKEAIDQYVARHDPEAVTAAMNRVAKLVGTRPDPGVANAARRILERTDW